MYFTKLFRSFALGVLFVSGLFMPLQAAHAGIIATDALLIDGQRTLDRWELK